MEWVRTEPTVMGPLRKRFFSFLVHPKMRHIHHPNCSGFLLTQDNRKCPTSEPQKIFYPGILVTTDNKLKKAVNSQESQSNHFLFFQLSSIILSV